MIEVKFAYQLRTENSSGCRSFRKTYSTKAAAITDINLVRKEGLWVTDDMIIMPQYILNAFIGEIKDE